MCKYWIGSLIIVFAAQALPAQQIRARVIDEASRAPVAGVVVVATGDKGVSRTETGGDGFFTLTLRGAGTYTISLESIGYAKATRPLVVAQTDTLTIPAFLLTSEVIAVSGVEATADRGRTDNVVGFNRKMFVAAGADLARMERSAVSMVDAIRNFGAGLKVRFTGRQRTPCIESTRRIASMNPSQGVCDMVAIYVDEIMINDVAAFLRSARLEQFESMQYLPPVEAGQRFGLEASAKGAIVFWSRGRGPYKSADRN